MNQKEFIEQLKEKEIAISDTQLQQFERYYQLLVEWNEKINLTAIVDHDEVYLKHFYDSITLGFYCDFKTEEKSLVDVGSGAGFPSIPLKILFPKLKITIIDSLNKRIHFIEKIVEELGLQEVYAYHDRAEMVGQNKCFREKFDYATARAVARLSVLSEYCLPLVKKGGQFIAMKATKSDEEIEMAKKAIALLGGQFREDIAFDLPNNAGERHIIRIAKKKETPKKYPRKPGTPAKSPLQ